MMVLPLPTSEANAVEKISVASVSTKKNARLKISVLLEVVKIFGVGGGELRDGFKRFAANFSELFCHVD